MLGVFAMTFNLDKNADNIIIHISGSITINYSIKIREQILLTLNQGYHHYTLDLAAADYIDSASLGIFVALHKIITQSDGSLTLINLNATLLEIFCSGQLEHTLNIKL